MKEVIINSVYTAKEFIVTLFYDEDRGVVYSIKRKDTSGYEFYQNLHIDITEEQKKEILTHAEEVWGSTQGLYLLKCFNPLSASLWQFIEDCWDTIKRQEPRLFPKH